MMFKDNMLEEYHAPVSEPLIQQIVKTHTEAETKEKPLSSLRKDMVLEKFENKNQNADLWIVSFEKSCTNARIEESKYAKALHFFIAGTVPTWYALATKQITFANDWAAWNASFPETYAERGWALVRYLSLIHISEPTRPY